MAAVMVVNLSHGATPTVVSAETGIGFARADGVTPTTPVPKPTATGTAFSWPKTISLHCTSGGGSTSITNRGVRMSGAAATGLEMFFKDGGASYSAASGNAAADSGTQAADPATYTSMTTTAQVYDAASVAATNSTRNGNYCLLAVGVSDNFAGGAGATTALPSVLLSYTEA